MDEQRLIAARVAALYSMARPAYVTALALGGIICVALWEIFPAALLLSWLAGLLAVTLARVAIHWRYALVQPDATVAIAWENRFAIGAFASGAAWTFAAVLLFPPTDPVLQLVVILVSGGVVAGSAAIYAASAKAVYAFSLLPLVAVTGQLAFQPGPGYRPLALAVAIFGLVMARMAHHIRCGIVETARARLANEALLDRANHSEKLLRVGDGARVDLISDTTELKNARDDYPAILAQENLVFDALPVGVAFVQDLTIVRCNVRLEEMLGYQPGELQGKSTRLWFNSEERWTAAQTETYARLANAGLMESDARLRRKDGTGLWCRVVARAIDPASPARASIVFTFADANERMAAAKALEKSEAMYRNLVEASSDLIWSLDSERCFTYLNAAGARRIYGREASEMIGRPFGTFVARELQARDHAVLRAVLAGESVFGHESRHLRDDGSVVDLSFNAIPLRGADGEVVGATGTARDISEQKRAAAVLHEHVERLRLAVDAADLYYWEWDADTDLIHWGRNPDMLRGQEGADMTWGDYAALVFPEDRERYLAAGRGAIELGEPFEIEYRVSAPDGRIVWFGARGVPVVGSFGRVSRMIGVSQDITGRKGREEAVRFLAYHDSLTGLPNRRLLDDRLKQAIYQAQRRQSKVAAMLIDLDDFKKVNDSAGHRAGDMVLREVAERLGGCMRKADTLARHGGDEFVIVLSDAQVENDCQVVADKILRAFARPFRIDGGAYSLGASIGISMFPADAGDGDALLRNADAAMYRAKQLGKNNYRFYGS